MENNIPLAVPSTTIGQIVVCTEDVLNADETPLPLKELYSDSLTSIYSRINAENKVNFTVKVTESLLTTEQYGIFDNFR